MPISLSQLKSLTSTKVFERGQSYFKNGDVAKVVQRGQLITAQVQGQEYRPYTVQITLNSQGQWANYSCSCPYDMGGICKHLVAVGLVLLQRPDEVAEKPSLNELLTPLSEADLRQLLLVLVEQQPNLINQIEKELKNLPSHIKLDPPADPTDLDLNQIYRQLKRTLNQELAAVESEPDDDDDYYGYEEEYREIDFEAHLQPYMEQATTLLDQGQVTSAAHLMFTVLKAYGEVVDEAEEEIIEFYEEVKQYFADIGDKLAEIWLSGNFTPAEQTNWLKAINEQPRYGSSFAPLTLVLQEGWQNPRLVSALQGSARPGKLWPSLTDTDVEMLARCYLRVLKRQQRWPEYLNLAQATQQFYLATQLYIQLGRPAEAAAYAQKWLTNSSEILAVAELLEEKNYSEQALEIAQFGLNLPPPTTSYPYHSPQIPYKLAQLAVRQAQKLGNQPLAIQALVKAFHLTYRLDDYVAVEKAAGEQWPTLKAELLQNVATLKNNSAAQLEIYLYEKMVPEVINTWNKLSTSFSYNPTLLTQVVHATQETNPDWAMTQYKTKAEAIMRLGESQHYERAAEWLKEVRQIYQQHGRLKEWQPYLKGLMDTHKKKYKLMALLNPLV